jgi:hypothetical protein
MQKNKIIGIVSVLVILGAVVILSSYMTNRSAVPVTETNNASTTPNTIATTTPPVVKVDTSSVYVDPVWKFSFDLPKGWAAKTLENSPTTSKYDILFAKSEDIKNYVGSPNPSLVVTRIDLTRTDTVQSAGADKIKALITGSSKDAAIDYIIDEMKRKVLNQYSVESNLKRAINGKLFYEILATYTGKTTGKKVVINDYIYLDEKVMYDIQIISYAEDFPMYKEVLEKAVNSFKI